jgi:hypothetical protein
VTARFPAFERFARQFCHPLLILQKGRSPHRTNRGSDAKGEKKGRVVMSAPTPLSLSAMAERLPDLVNNDQSLLRRGRHITATDMMIEIGGQSYFLTIDQGRVTDFQRGSIIMKSWAFAVRGAEEAWDKFWQPLPPPNSHDIFALAKQGAFRIEGDYRPLITNLLYFKALLAAPRTLRTKA